MKELSILHPILKFQAASNITDKKCVKTIETPNNKSKKRMGVAYLETPDTKKRDMNNNLLLKLWMDLRN